MRRCVDSARSNEWLLLPSADNWKPLLATLAAAMIEARLQQNHGR